jgi:hypothetical protein
LNKGSKLLIYNLNLNYGKVQITGKGEERAAVFNDKGKMVHLPFKGSVDINDANNGYLTSFFGSSGYKANNDDSWTFCIGLLLCYVESDCCYALTQDDKPIDCTSSHALYDHLTSLIALGDAIPPSNVYKLR